MLRQAHERHPAIRSGAVIAVEGGSFSKPLMRDTITILLLLSEREETDIDVPGWMASVRSTTREGGRSTRLTVPDSGRSFFDAAFNTD